MSRACKTHLSWEIKMAFIFYGEKKKIKDFPKAFRKIDITAIM